MTVEYVLNAEPRNDVGKGASRRLRRLGKVPGILYGAHREPLNLTLLQNEILRQLRDEGFYSHILTLNIAGRPSERVVLRDLQRHPFKPTILHMDLQRIVEDEEIRVRIPLDFLNEERCKGVRQDGGIISRMMIEVEVSCLPKNLPESIEIDLLNVGINESITISELTLPEGVELVHLIQGGDGDMPVVSVIYPTGAGGDDEGLEEGEAKD